MTGFSRRDFSKLAGAAGAGALTSAAWGTFAIAQGVAKVLIVGGGAGGATAAAGPARALLAAVPAPPPHPLDVGVLGPLEVASGGRFALKRHAAG